MRLPFLDKLTKVGLQPPAPAPDRRGIGIGLVVKNEADHIGEWARFHHAIGVRRFVVYDGASTDGTLDALRAAVPPDIVTVIPWAQSLSDIRLEREIHNQVLAYAHAAANYGGDLRWMAFIDVDEFLIPTRGETLDAALEGLDVPYVALPWHMFGHSGHDAAPDGGVLANYTRRARDPMSDVRGVRAFKSLIDPCRLTALRVHSAETDEAGAVWNDAGKRFTMKERERPGFYSTDRIQLNHYYARSRAELEAKIARGPNLKGKMSEYGRKVRRTVANIEADEVEDLTAATFAQRLWNKAAP